MHRALETTLHFGVRSMVCVNKSDVFPAGTAEIDNFCRESNIEIAGKIPFDLTVSESMVHGEAVTAYQPDAPASMALTEIWDNLHVILTDE